MRGDTRIGGRLRALVLPWHRPAAAAVLCVLALAVSATPGGATDAISFHGSTQATYSSDSSSSISLTAPSGAQAGDVLIATIGFGSSMALSQPALTAPSGWTLVTRANYGWTDAVAVYRHVFAAGETRYTWTSSILIGGTSFLSAFAGVDPTSPVDVANGQYTENTASPATPSLATTTSGDLLIASYYGYRSGAAGGTWTPPTGMTEISDASNGGSRSGSVAYVVQPSAGSTGAKTATASATLNYGIAALVALKPAPTSSSTPSAPTGIAFHGAASTTYASDSTTSLKLNVPAGAVTGDVLIASLGFGSSVAKSQPTLAAPSGWTLVSRTNKDPVGALAVYQHILGAGETSFAWTASIPVGGSIFLAAFGGVDTTNPVDTSAGQVVTGTATVAAPSVTTTQANDLLVAGYFAHKDNALGTTWTPPSGMTEAADASNGGSRSGAIDYGLQATAGSTGPRTATASSSQDYAIAALVALRPAGAPPPPPPSTGGIVFHGETQASYPSDSTTSLRLNAPGAAATGDVLVAALGFGSSSATAQPTLTAPAGWTLVSRTNKDAVGALAVYQHVFTAGETSYTWTASRTVGGTVFLAAFAGLDTATPVDIAGGQTVLSASAVAAPALTTTASGDLLLTSFYGHRDNATGDTWAGPSDMTEIGDASNGGSRSGSIDYVVQAASGTTGTKTATASAVQQYAIAALVALRPAGAPPPPPPPGPAPVTFHGSTQASYASDSTTSLRLTAPAAAESGDVLLASLGFGSSSAKSQPTLTAPTGWTLVTKVNKDPVGTVAVYRHVFTAGETSWTWTTSIRVGGTIFVSAFAGLDPANPVDVVSGQTLASTASGTAPSLTTTAAGDLLVGSFYGHKDGSSGGSWSVPTGMTEIADANNGGSRSGSVDYAVQSAAGATGTKTATASVSQDYTIAALVALRAALVSSTSAPAPLAVTIDTDMYSSPDDAEAMAIAFALQLKGEAKVIAIGVDTRDSRVLTPDSWKCVAAIAQFYRSGNVPIGVDPPANGSTVNSPDVVGPCARLAAPSTPTPDTAVNVYRRALAAQPDGSVVMISTGYLENLRNLLISPADAISPLSGSDLVARKVRRLVVMGGGYPSRAGETNLTGYASAAQYVAANWPTKLVWAGYEVGNAVTTGQTISSVHPAWSPVRVAYEALIKPGNWYYSYDLTAAYHAIRPDDANLVESGPGTNVVDSVGGNVFTAGAGNQYYLRLGDPAALGSTLEGLLDTIPAG